MHVSLPAFGESFVSSVDEQQKRLTITSASYPLIITQGAASGDVVTIPADYDVTIRADRVIVRGAIKTPGRSIAIYARVVEGEEGASFDTSGATGGPPPPPEPMDPRQPAAGHDERWTKRGGNGERGIDAHHGSPGIAGKPAGHITIFAGELRGRQITLLANGGNGGAGQGAQAAVAGARGGNGGDANGNPDHNPAGDGGDGGDGGHGGVGGTGGAAGTAGKIVVRALRAPPTAVMRANGGTGGAGGAGTQGTAGGIAGRDGQHMGGRPTKPGNPGRRGNDGAAGAAGANTPAVVAEQRSAIAADLADGVTAAQMQMILRLATLRMLLHDENRQEIASMLAYVMDLSTTKRSDAQLDAAYQRANALLFQIARGLDPQGHPENFAPRLDLDTYRTNLDRFVASFKGVRDDYRAYFNAQGTREQKIAGLDEIRKKADTLISDLDTQAKSGLEIAASLIKLSDASQQRCNAQLQKWRDALAAFEDQLKQVAKERACVLDTLDTLLKGIDVLAMTGDATVKKISGYAHDAKKLVDAAIPDELKPSAIDKTITKLDSLGDNVGDLANAYKQNASLIIDQKDPNAYKLLVNQEQLDAALKPYLEKFGSAAALKTAMDDYVKLVQARNDLIMKFNAQVATLAGVKSQRAEAQAQRTQAEELLARRADPVLVELATFAGNVFHATKELCVEQLYLTWKAAVFYSLDHSFDVFERIRNLGAKTDLDWSAFESGANAVVKHLQDAEEKFGADVIAFPRNDTADGVVISITDTASLEALRTNKRLTIRLAPAFPTSGIEETPFTGMADVRIKRARVWIKGAKTNDKELSVYLTHSGLEKIIDRKGKAIEFIHSEVQTRLRYNYDTRDIREGGDIRLPGSKYAAVGPFSEWRIVVDPGENRGLDLTAVSEIRLKFHVTHRLFEGKGLRAEREDATVREGTLVAEYVD